METYVREHHTQLRRRLESVKRIHKASDTVEQRLQELTVMHDKLIKQHEGFNSRQDTLVDLLVDEESVDTTPKIEDTNSNVLHWEHKVNF